MNRRDFFKRSIMASMGLAASRSALGAGTSTYARPNILVILVDEMRALKWIPQPILAKLMPNLSALLAKSARFDSYYTSATACSAARGSLVTGLYAHQTSVLTNFPGLETLPPEMPTYGTALSSLGYDTFWYGKWHLAGPLNTNMAQYGFGGGTFPDPVGLPNQGRIADPKIVDQFHDWLRLRTKWGGHKPWCTTVSLVNPHDITGFWRMTEKSTEYGGPFPLPAGFLDAPYFAALDGRPCGNFENPTLFGAAKPALQLLAAQTIADIQGAIAYAPNAPLSDSEKPFEYWQKCLQLYAYLHSKVDVEIGRVLDRLKASPFADNTVVVFTADHGDYAGAHGLQGKNGSAYEEATNVPLAVYDPTGLIVKRPDITRQQLFSSVDLMPMLMTIGSGGSTAAWKPGGAYSYLSGRADLHRALQNPFDAGRDYILFTTDEWVPLQDLNRYHVVSLRTPFAKLSAYSAWSAQGTARTMSGEELELYDFRAANFSEVDNEALTSDLTPALYQLLLGDSGNGGLLASEIRAPLPTAMEAARQAGLQRYLKKVG